MDSRIQKSRITYKNLLVDLSNPTIMQPLDKTQYDRICELILKISNDRTVSKP